ncbi:hypothetical protein V8C44DRAFT_335356 [Trichoderma aethiopicum]
MHAPAQTAPRTRVRRLQSTKSLPNRRFSDPLPFSCMFLAGHMTAAYEFPYSFFQIIARALNRPLRQDIVCPWISMIFLSLQMFMLPLFTSLPVSKTTRYQVVHSR